MKGPIEYIKNNTNDYAGHDGISHHMKKIYLYLCMAIGLSGAISFFLVKSGILMAMFTSFHHEGATPFLLNIILFGLMIFFAISISAKMHKYSSKTLFMFFMIYSTLVGINVSPLFLFCNTADILTSFAVASLMFGSMAIYGYTTNKDLTSMGAYLFMGLVGILVASIIGFFVHSSFFHLLISYIGVIIFTCYVAYDTHQIKSRYQYATDYETSEKLVILGALHLYMDFVQIFLHILRILLLNRSRD